MLSKEQALDLVAEGLVTLGEATQNLDLVRAGKFFYTDVEGAFRAKLKPDEPCLLAMPSILVKPDMRPPCFVAVQPSQVIIAWRKGLFRKTTFTEVIPQSKVTDVRYGRGQTSATRNAFVLTVVAGEETTFALPVDQPVLGAKVRDAILAGPVSQP
jgi:hypothetical protein